MHVHECRQLSILQMRICKIGGILNSPGSNLFDRNDSSISDDHPHTPPLLNLARIGLPDENESDVGADDAYIGFGGRMP